MALGGIDHGLQEYLGSCDLKTLDLLERFQDSGRFAIHQVEVREVKSYRIARFVSYRTSDAAEKLGVFAIHVTVDTKDRDSTLVVIDLLYLSRHLLKLDATITQKATSSFRRYKFFCDEKYAGKYQTSRDQENRSNIFTEEHHSENKSDQRLQIDENCDRRWIDL